MALRTPLQYDNIAGQSVIGPIAEPFTLSQEFITLNGVKLYRTIGGTTRDYSVSASGDPDDYDTITLTTPIADNNDVLEIIINDPDLVPVEDKLDDILTALTGSWIWDKSTNIMTMLNTSGVERFKFEVHDEPDSASRERRQDLEV